MKKNRKDKIYQKDWLDLHPYSTPVNSDVYFVNLSNRFLETIEHAIGNAFSNKVKHTIALSVAAYFEDIISGLGLWQGFTKKHFAMYGKYLPFYQLSKDYFPDEINCEDILFLIWSCVQQEEIEFERIINPENPIILALGLVLFDILEEEYETAPENEYFQDFFTQKVNYADFYEFRTIASWLFYSSYLMSPYTKKKAEETAEEVKKCDTHKEMLLYGLMNDLLFRSPCGPLALKINEWMSSIVGEDTDFGKMLHPSKFKHNIFQHYLITDINKLGVTLSPTDSEQVIFLSNDTMEDNIPYKKNDVVLGNLIYYNGRWELNGFFANNNREEYEKEKVQNTHMVENIEHSRKMYLTANKNKPMRYFKDGKEVEAFFHKAYSLNDTMGDTFQHKENLVSFANVENGVTIISDIAVFIKDKDNPYYDPKESNDNGLALLVEYQLDQELIEYLVKNNLIPDLKMNSLKGKKHGTKLVQDNLDFMFRFYQPQSYI